jgi:hypothetical protein
MVISVTMRPYSALSTATLKFGVLIEQNRKLRVTLCVPYYESQDSPNSSRKEQLVSRLTRAVAQRLRRASADLVTGSANR